MKMKKISELAMSQPETERIRTYFLTGLVKKFSPHRKVARMASEKGYKYEICY